MGNKKSFEYLKYKFSDAEKAEISTSMAQKVTERQSAEDEKKAIMSDYKSQVDGITAEINSAAIKINNGYEMRQIECEIVPNYENKVWLYTRVDNGEVAKELPMSEDDMQMNIEDSLEPADEEISEKEHNSDDNFEPSEQEIPAIPETDD